MNERVNMRCLPGMNLEMEEHLEIWKGICGLVQSARVHWLKMTKALVSQEVCFLKSEGDQCLFMWMVKHGPVMSLLHVDDLCVFGVREDMDEVKSAVREKVTVKPESGLKDFLGFEIL